MAAPKKKKTGKNSNYKPVYKYVSVEQLCKKVLCDFRNTEPPKEYQGEKPEVDQNLYDSAVEFCTIAEIITPEEKADLFDGKNHVPMSDEEVADFTGIPLHQIQKNMFAFKIKNNDEFLRVTSIRVALCDLYNGMLQNAKDRGEELTETENRKVAAYLNFAAYTGLISEEQVTSIYLMMKQNLPLQIPFIASLTGVGEEELAELLK